MLGSGWGWGVVYLLLHCSFHYFHLNYLHAPNYWWVGLGLLYANPIFFIMYPLCPPDATWLWVTFYNYIQDHQKGNVKILSVNASESKELFSLLDEFHAAYGLHTSVHVSITESSPMAEQVFDCHSRSLASNSEVASKYVGQLGVPVKTEVKIKFNSSLINIQNPFGLNGVWSRHQLVFISTFTLTKMLPPYFPSF